MKKISYPGVFFISKMNDYLSCSKKARKTAYT